MADSKKYKIDIEITGDKEAINSFKNLGKAADDAQKDIDSASQKSSSSSSNAETSIKKSNDNIAASFVAGALIAKGAMIAQDALIDTFKTAFKEAAQEETAMAKLNATLKLTGSYTAQSANGFKTLADQIEKSSFFSAEEVLNQISLAKQLGYTDTEVTNLALAAKNMAIAMNMDLGSAMQNLLGSLNGVAGRMARTNPELKSMTEAQLKAGSAVSYFKDMVLDSNALMQTQEGILHQLGVSYGDVTGELGKAILGGSAFKQQAIDLNTLMQDGATYISENAEAVRAGAFIVTGVVVGLTVATTAFAVSLAAAAAEITVMTAGLNLLAAVGIGAVIGLIASEATKSSEPLSELAQNIKNVEQEQMRLAKLKDVAFKTPAIKEEIVQSEIRLKQLQEEVRLYKEKATAKSEAENPVSLTRPNVSVGSFDPYGVISGVNNDINMSMPGAENRAQGDVGYGIIDANQKGGKKSKETDPNAAKNAKLSQQIVFDRAIAEESLAEQQTYIAEASALDATYYENRKVIREDSTLSEEEKAQQLKELDMLRKEDEINAEYDHAEALLGIQLEKEMTASTLLENKLEQEKAQQDAKNKWEIETLKNQNKKKQDLDKEADKKGAEQQSEADKKALNDKQKTMELFTGLASSENKTLAAIGKAAVLTRIAQATPDAVSSAFAYGSTIGGPPIGFLFGGIAAAAMAAQAAQAMNVKGFETGGISGFGGVSRTGDARLAYVNDGEMHLSMADQSQLFKAIQSGDLGGSGGSTTEAIYQLIDAVNLKDNNVYMDGISVRNSLLDVDKRYKR